MTLSEEVTAYVKTQAKFVGKVFLATTVGGIAGSATGAVLDVLRNIPLVSSAPHLGTTGATLGFVVAFLTLLVEKYKE